MRQYRKHKDHYLHKTSTEKNISPFKKKVKEVRQNQRGRRNTHSNTI